MSIEGQGHFFTIYFSGFVCVVLYLDRISGERLQDHWSSGCFGDLVYKFRKTDRLIDFGSPEPLGSQNKLIRYPSVHPSVRSHF